jgi:hypothetical protein
VRKVVSECMMGASWNLPTHLLNLRHSLYECLHRRGDALFELTDAILTADSAVPSPVHLSLQTSHRRGWGSLYAALWRGRIDTEALRELLARHPLAASETPVYAVDTSVWPRCDAQCSSERGFYHPSFAPLLRPADRGRMGLPVRHTTQLRPRELDCCRGRRARQS